MPNRIIKETIRTSEKLNTLSDFEFRLWVSLLVSADDFGRGDARPRVIRGSCFSLRDITTEDVEKALAKLEQAGCIGIYEDNGKPLFYFKNWENHQQIRNKKSKYPAPCNQLISNDINCNQLSSESNPIQSKPNPIRIQSNRTPSLEEIKAYALEKGLTISPLEFFSHYESVGWKINGEPIRNWKNALLAWERSKNENDSRNTESVSKWNIKPDVS